MSAGEANPTGRERAARGSRRRSRELALQSLYQWLLNRETPQNLLAQATEHEQFARADRSYFHWLVHGVIEQAAELDAALQPFLDRAISQLSPIEHALLLMAAYELTAGLDVPYRVVLNEAVELAKSYGGTDGHKYINGVLDKLAMQLRPHESRKT